MIERNYLEIAEKITPTFIKNNQKIGWAIIQGVASLCQETYDEIRELMEFWNLDRDIAGNLEAIGHLFSLERNGENAQTFKAKIITRIALDSSSGTPLDLENLFNNLVGEGEWKAENPDTAEMIVYLRGFIATILKNLITRQNENLVTNIPENLVASSEDPLILEFLKATLAAGVRLDILENQEV